MAFEGLTEKLSSAFKKLRNKGRLTESDVKEAMREIRLALLEADVSYKVVKDFIKAVTEKAVGAEVLESLTPAQAIVKIVNQELVSLMGGGSAKITIASQPPTVVMMVGLQGAGKTTNGAKLAGLPRGPAPAARFQRIISAPSAASLVRPALRDTGAISAAGSLPISRSRRSSARNAATRSTTTIRSDAYGNEEYRSI